MQLKSSQSLFTGINTKIPLLNGGQTKYINFDNAASTPPFKAVKNAGDSGDTYIEIPTIPTIPIIGSSLNNDPLPKTDDTLNTPEAVLGLPLEKAIEIWRSESVPVIHLGPRENC